MENYYFPLFLVVVAAAVVLIFKKAGSGHGSARSRVSRTPSGRTVDGDRLHRNMDRVGPGARQRILSDPAKAKDIWQKRREHKVLDSYAEVTARRGVHHAGYIGPHADTERRGSGGYPLRDQNISKSEHLGIDEYLTKREREKAEAEAEETGGLSMTAMKYEPGDASSEAGKGRKKQAGFKP